MVPKGNIFRPYKDGQRQNVVGLKQQQIADWEEVELVEGKENLLLPQVGTFGSVVEPLLVD